MLGYKRFFVVFAFNSLFSWNPEHLDRVNRRENCQNCDLSGADLSGLNLYRLDLSNSNLSGANLSNANLDRVEFAESDLTGARFDKSSLNFANFYNATLNQASFSQARLLGTDFENAIFDLDAMRSILNDSTNFHRVTVFPVDIIRQFTPDQLGISQNTYNELIIEFS